jgi:glycosyltransferase involved in cell wall biosynthesis
MEAAAKHKISNPRAAVKKKIAIVTCCLEDWGGSEDLWWKTALHLQEQGFSIMVVKYKINPHHPKFAELSQKGILLKELDTFLKKSRSERLFIKAWDKIRRVYPNRVKTSFENCLKSFQPDHVLISQGINFDGMLYAHCCVGLHIPFSLLSHKAIEFYWPQPDQRTVMLEAFQKAKKCFFVSHHSQQLTEEQFGMRFTNAEVVRNPVKKSKGILAYPSTENGFKLACIGRLFIIDKGQDILLRVLSQKKWKERPLRVSFIGTGVDMEALKAMANLLDVTSVEFKGAVENMEAVWSEHHALVLPSRSEGLPLVIFEAMTAGRTVIAAKAGGIEEVIEEGKTGFLGEASTTLFDQVLEKAWQHRNEWETMGNNAFHYALTNIPQTPELDFVNTLTNLIYES